MNTVQRFAGIFVSLALSSMAAAAPPPQATAWPSAEWQAATPESAGLDSARLKGVLELVRQRGWRVDSIQVVRHGRLVLDAYFYPFAQGQVHDLRSVTKSVTSSLLGLSIAQGKWPDVDVPVLGQFPERQFGAVDAWKKAVTLGNLVDMRSGLSWFNRPLAAEGSSSTVQMQRTRDWVGYVLDQPMICEPGSLFLYSNGNTNVLAALIGRAWRQPAREVARERLFRPIGISRFEWAGADPEGNTIGAWSLALAPRDMARLGLLWLHDGVWRNERLLPEGWTGRLLEDGSGSWATGGFLYKRAFWIDPISRTFRALGQHGQLIMVDPALDMVVVVTSKAADGMARPDKVADGTNIPDIYVMNEIRYLASQAGDLPENPSGQAELRAMLRKIAQPPRLAGEPGGIPAGRCGRTWRLGNNALGLASLRLEPDPADTGSMILEFGPASGNPARCSCGLDGAFRFNPDPDHRYGAFGPDPGFGSYNGQLAFRGSWPAPDSFDLEGQYIESSMYMNLHIQFRSDGIIVDFEDNENRHEVIRSLPPSAGDSLDAPS